MQQNTKEIEKINQKMLLCKPTAKLHIIITIKKVVKLDSKVQMQHSCCVNACNQMPPFDKQGCGEH